jgi:hypothetical protein
MKKDTIVLTGLTVAALCMGKIIVDMLESNDCSYQAFKFSYPFSDKQKKIIKNQYDDYMGDSVTAEDLEDAKYYRTIAKNLISGNLSVRNEVNMKEYLYKIFKLVFKNRYDKDVLKLKDEIYELRKEKVEKVRE